MNLKNRLILQGKNVKIGVLTRGNDLSNISEEEIYMHLLELPRDIRVGVQRLVEDCPLNACKDKYKIHVMEDFD